MIFLSKTTEQRRRGKWRSFCVIHCSYVAYWFYINATYLTMTHTESRMLRNDARHHRHILSLYTTMPSSLTSVCLLNHHRGGGVVWCNVTRGGGCRGRRQKFALFAWFIVIYVAHWFYINGTYVPSCHTESCMLRNDVRRRRRLRHILSLYTMMPSLSSTTRRRQTGEGLCKK